MTPSNVWIWGSPNIRQLPWVISTGVNKPVLALLSEILLFAALNTYILLHKKPRDLPLHMETLLAPWLSVVIPASQDVHCHAPGCSVKVPLGHCWQPFGVRKEPASHPTQVLFSFLKKPRLHTQLPWEQTSVIGSHEASDAVMLPDLHEYVVVQSLSFHVAPDCNREIDRVS